MTNNTIQNNHSNKKKDWEDIRLSSEESLEDCETTQQITCPSREELEKTLDETETKMQQYHVDLERVKEELTDSKDKYLRTLAEYDTYRRNAVRNEEKAAMRASFSVLERILPVLDNLERSLEVDVQSEKSSKLFESLRMGVQLTLKQFQSVLDGLSVQVINPIPEETFFDPRVHEAISVQEHAVVKSNIVLKVLQKGYLWREQIIRPALVIVAKTIEKKSESA